MFRKKPKDEATKKQKSDEGKNTIQVTPPGQFLSGNMFTNTSSSYSRQTTVTQTSSIRAFKSTSTIYDKKDVTFPDISKRFSFDAALFSPPSSNTNIGYQSPFNRRLNPINLPSGSTNSTSSSSNYGGERFPTRTITSSSASIPRTSTSPSSNSIIASSPFTRQDRYNIERNLNPTIGSENRINSVGKNQSGSIVPEYNTKGLKRGNVLVINNIKFLNDNEERKGAETDEKNVIDMFRKFGFDVQNFRNLKKKDILKKVTEFRSAKSLSKYDISVVIIMSHGSNKGIRGGYTEITGVDGEGLSTEDIVDQFTIEKCPGMKGKPKIFIFQCCRGGACEVQVDVTPINKPIKNNADILIAYSTLPGFVSLRNPVAGSWFIKCIIEVFQEHAKTLHVEDLLKIVDEKLSIQHPQYKQTSTYENRGFKTCYLNPK